MRKPTPCSSPKCDDKKEQEGEDAAEEGGDAHDQFEQYCSQMSAAAAWGSQLELGALAQSLRRRIEVFSVGLPTVLMGEAFEGVPCSCPHRKLVDSAHGDSLRPLSKPANPASPKIETGGRRSLLSADQRVISRPAAAVECLYPGNWLTHCVRPSPLSLRRGPLPSAAQHD